MGESSNDEFTNLPIDERIQHKNWKARKSGYEDLAKEFRKLDPQTQSQEFLKYSSELINMAKDTNLAAQESGLACVLSYFDNFPENYKNLEDLIPVIIQKGLTSMKQGSKSASINIILMLVELEHGQAIIDLMLPFLDNKQPKLVTACVFVFKEIVEQFGARALSIKGILKNLGKMFGHSDPNVRAEAFKLVVAIYPWLKKSIDPFITGLKPVQIKDLNSQFEEMEQVNPKAPRLLRSQQANDVDEISEGEEQADDMKEDSIEEDPIIIDPYEVSEPIDITNEVPENFYTEINSKKWQERKEALVGLQKIVNKVKLSNNGPYNEIIKELTAHVTDANVLVGALAVNCIELIAKGLRENFSAFKPTVLPPILEKLKEKKQNFVDALRGALDAIFAATSLIDVLDDIIPQLSHKNPQVKTETVRWLTRILKTVKSAPAKGNVKIICEGLLKTYQDGDTTVREVSAECLGTLMKVSGEKNVSPFIEGLDKIKTEKVKDYFEKTEVQVKKVTAPKSVPVKKATPPKKIPSKATPTTSSMPKKAISSIPKSAVKPTVPPSRQTKPGTTATAKPVPGKKAPTRPSVKEVNITFKYSSESVEGSISEFLSAKILEGIKDGAWKIRLEAIEGFLNYVVETPDGQLEPELLIRQLQIKPGFKEANFQVMSRMFGIFNALCENHSNFTYGCATLTMPLLVDKLGDIKLKRSASDCLEAYAEKLSIKFVFDQCFPLIKEVKSPKIQGDALVWVKQCINNFGIANLQVKPLIEFAATFLGSSNATVRSNAVKLLAEIRVYAGPKIRAFFEDLSPSLLSTIDAEFAKVENRRPPTPTKFEVSDKKPSKEVVDEDVSAAKSMADSDDMMDDLFPREDISHLINTEILSQLDNSNWKLRKEGLDNVKQILEEKKRRIKPNIGDLPNILKKRLEDSNKNLVYFALELCEILAESIGAPFEGVGRNLIEPICSCLNDLKPNVRAAGTKALTSIADVSGLGFMTPFISTSLTPESQNLRKELTNWLSNRLSNSNDLSNLSPLITPLMLCLQDKNSEVRKHAAKSLGIITTHLGYNIIHDKCMSLKPAFQSSVLQVIDQFKSTAKPIKSRSTTPSQPKATGGSSTLKRTSTIVRKVTPTNRVQQNQEKSKLQEISIVNYINPNQKTIRLSKDKVNRWVFETPPSDLIDTLIDQSRSCFSIDFHKLIFSNGNNKDKNYVLALTQLNKIFEDKNYSLKELNLDELEMKERLINISDILFKIIVIRLYDQGTTILIKCMDLLKHLIGLFKENNLQISDTEVNILLPTISHRLGLTNETLRKKVKEIVNELCNIYPPNKTFPLLMTYGLNTKNSRGKAETLEELGNMIQLNGISVCNNPSRVLPNIAIYVGDRDAAVRNGAINALTQAYILIGEQVYKYIGQLPPKEKGYLEERFKRTKTNAIRPNSRPRSNGNHDPDAPVFSFQRDRGNDDSFQHTASSSSIEIHQQQRQQHQLQPSINTSNILELSSSPQYDNNSNNDNEEILYDQDEHLYPKTAMERILSGLKDGNHYQVTKYLEDIEQLIAGPIDEVVPFMDELIVLLSCLLENLFNNKNTPSRLFLPFVKQVVTTFMQIFSYPLLGEALASESLSYAIEEIIRRILEQKSNVTRESVELTRQLNVLMIKVLDNTSPTNAFQALLYLLRESILKNTNSINDFQVKYSSILMKCTWKLTRNIGNQIQSNTLNVDKLLGCVNDFFGSFSYEEINNENDLQSKLIFKTVKTILFEICSVLKNSIYDHLSEIEVDTPNDYVTVHLNKLLNKIDNQKLSNDNKTKIFHQRQEENQNNATYNESLSLFLESMLMNFNLTDEPSNGLIKNLYSFLKRNPNYYGIYQDHLEKRGLSLFDKVDNLLKQYEEKVNKDSFEIDSPYATRMTYPENESTYNDNDINFPPNKKYSPEASHITPREENHDDYIDGNQVVYDLRSKLSELRLTKAKKQDIV